jgi:holo-ACP synthase
MRYAKLRSELLAARELRQQELERALAKTGQTLVSLALNLPGPQKCPPGSGALAAWAEERLGERLPGLRKLHGARDPLGPFALYTTAAAPRTAKQCCVAIEEAHPAARLLDLDVHAATGSVDRTTLDLSRRGCLLCGAAAVDCIRLHAHDLKLVIRRAHELIAAFAG